ncbi:MAG: NADPH-dependent FMN reductase [Bacteroidota bacterium]|jgi:chromate reductase
MNTSIHIVGISGSLRKGSYNTALLRAVRELLPVNTTFEIASIGDLPMFNADLVDGKMPDSVSVLRSTLSKADAFVIASPEYNYSIPGGLKNAIDWMSRGKDSPLTGKPVAVMGATNGMWGTVRMQGAFRPIFQYLNMVPVNKPEVLVAQAHTKFDETGTLIDEQTRDIMRKQLAELQKQTNHIRLIGD